MLELQCMVYVSHDYALALFYDILMVSRTCQLSFYWQAC